MARGGPAALSLPMGAARTPRGPTPRIENPEMTAPSERNGRTTGALFIGGPLAFAAAATVLSSTFDWPDVLREPAEVALPDVVAGGTSLVWMWMAHCHIAEHTESGMMFSSTVAHRPEPDR